MGWDRGFIGEGEQARGAEAGPHVFLGVETEWGCAEPWEAEVADRSERIGETISGLTDPGAAFDSTVFEDCVFERCVLKEAVFEHCVLRECRFTECDLSLLRVPGTVISGCELEDCKAMGINWTEARWPTARLSVPLRFERCVLSHSTFLGLDLSEIPFMECIIRDADFREACLSGCVFQGTDLAGSVFHEADLSGADLSGARDYSIDARRTVLKGARFSLPEALSLLGGLEIELSGSD
jgi:uncharacterized protein YjbI with pentapeptide repeats